MANPITYSTRTESNLRPGIDLRWPASVLWRPDDIAVRKITLQDVKDAITEGIDDFRAMPTHAIFLCVVYPVVGFILYRLLSGYHLLPLVYPITAGFALLGPAAAVGLYEMSRRREHGLDVTAADALEVIRSPSIGAILRLTLVLAAIFFGWLYTALLIYTQLFGSDVPQSLSELFTQAVNSPEGLQLIIAGNAVGFVFAVVVLAISTISFPMLVDRNVSAATAVRTSVRAAIENPLPFALWGLIVAVSLVLGALLLLVGLVVVLPVLGHATWHLYRKLVAPE